MQSQMAAAKTHVRTAQFKMEALPSLTWSGEQTKPAFDGWRILDKSEKVKETEAADEAAWLSWTPHMVANKVVHWSTLQADEVFTKPPGRYTEATLIRELEKRGIGRPSTFASLVTTLFDRDYVEKTNKEGQVYETRHLSLVAKATKPKETKESHKAGAEKNKIAATSLGISVVDYLNQDFSDLFAYDFTAHMEGTLDQIAKGDKAWKEILQETWDTYKERYDAIQAEKGNGKSKAISSTADESEPGVKLIQTKLGPRLVRPKADGSGDEFAALPEGITFANAEKKLTEALIEAAFETAKAAREGEEVGVWLEKPILKKRGPFGFYVESDGIKVPWKPEDTEETLVAKLEAKKGAFERKVGDWTIKQGPYGYYFYKPNPKGKKGPPKFHKFPADADPQTVTTDILDAAAAAPKPPTRRPPPKKKE
jgi:DNA topoisomerase-1